MAQPAKTSSTLQSMARSFALALLLGSGCAQAARAAAGNTIPLDFSVPGHSYEGIGALSGGGGVTRLLIDYPPALQSDIYDILFKPNAGASLQVRRLCSASRANRPRPSHVVAAVSPACVLPSFSLSLPSLFLWVDH